MVAIGISGPVKKYGRRDLDNMAKVILDAGNKIVYSDDRLVEILLVQKQIWEKNLQGFMIAVRPLQQGEPDKYTPRLIQSSHDPSKAPTETYAPVVFQHYQKNGRSLLEPVQFSHTAPKAHTPINPTGYASTRKTNGPKK
jgi:hypothetical protein